MDIILYLKSILGLTGVLLLLYIFLKFLQKYTTLGNKNFTDSKDSLMSINSVLYLDSDSKIINLSCKSKKYLILISKNQNLLIDSYEEN
jgi:hypothetical protein